MVISRELLEEKEAKVLAPYALKSKDSAGRKFKEEEDKYRLCFQKDKERIIHCKAFRRLDEKTQVFVAGSGDHYRTRLTHTLEVAQIARDIARRLGLNEDLCEAIALAHDLGHPPFGHAGEEILDEIMQRFSMHFEHNEQSRRVVERLEKAYPEFDGLNLTVEVLDGLIKHQTAFDQADMKFEVSPHLEAQVVNLSDEIAYVSHDIDDGLRSGLINIEQFENFDLWRRGEELVYKKYGKGLDEDVFVSRMTSAIISMMIEDLCACTFANLKEFGINSAEDVRNHKTSLAHFSDEMQRMVREFREFLLKNFYMNPKVIKFVIEGKRMIEELFDFYLKNSDKFPGEVSEGQELIISVKDYIAGMTDSFLKKAHNELQLGG
jgi:dGTPase